MKQRRRFRARRARVEYGGQRRVFDLDAFGGVLGEITAVGYDQRDRLAHVAYALVRERPLIDRRLERDEERIAELAHVLAGEDRPHALLRQRRAHIDAYDLGVRMRGADDVRGERSRRHRQIVGVTPAARQQRRVFLAQQRSAERLGHGSPRGMSAGRAS